MNVESSSSLGAKTVRRSAVRMEAQLHVLESARRRRRLLEALGGPVLWGALLSVWLLAAGHYVPALHHPGVVVGTLAVCGAIALQQAWGRRRSLLGVAQWVDREAGLDERVSSAFTFLATGQPTPMMHATVHDAAEKLASVQDEEVARPPSGRWLVLPLLLLALPFLAMLPPRRTPAQVAQLQVRQGLQATGGALVAAAEGMESQLGDDVASGAQAAVAETRAAGRALQQGEVDSREAAMERLQRAQEGVDATLRADRSRQLLGERLRENTLTRAAGEALERGETAAAAAALRQAADDLGTQDVRGAAGQELADDLRHAAQALAPGEAQAAANRAAAGAESGREDTAADGLRTLADQVERMTALGEDRDVVEQAAEALRAAREQVGEQRDVQPPGQGQSQPAAPQRRQAGDTKPGAEAGQTGGAPQPFGAAGQAEPGAGASGSPELGEPAMEAPLTLDPGTRVAVAGQLLAGERSAGQRGGSGPRVEEDAAPDMRRAVEQIRTLGEAELASQEIPPGYRALVREYFTTLEEVAAGQTGQSDR